MSKLFIWLGIFIGSAVFGAIPLLWGEDYFSGTSILLSFIGSVVGVFAGWKLGQMMG